MNKKLIAGLLAVTLCFTMFGCKGASDDGAGQGVSVKEEDVPPTLSFNGNTVSLNDNPDDVLATLGDADKTEQLEACVDYFYGGVRIEVFNNNGDKTIAGIYATDDSATTADGISVGSSYDDLIAAYGEPSFDGESSEGQEFTYVYSAFTITFTVSQDVVTKIGITAGMG